MVGPTRATALEAAATMESIKAEKDAIAMRSVFYIDEKNAHLEKTSELRLEILNTYIKEIDVWRQKLDNLVSQLCSIEKDKNIRSEQGKEIYETMRYLRESQQAFMVIRREMPEYLEENSQTRVTETESLVSSNDHRAANLKLPKIEIPNFHGDFLEWSSFKDTFEAAIHNTAGLSKVQKFAYLKSLVKGEAARYIADIPLTDANYDIAWKQLHARYENKRKIAFATMDKFKAQPKTNNSAKSVKGLIDAASRCVRGLEQLGFVYTEMADFMIVHEMVSKLDSATRDLWDHKLKDKEVPSVERLSEFLERHATALDDQQTPIRYEKKPNVHHANGEKSSFAHYTNPNREERKGKSACLMGCSHKHATFKCKVFLGLSVEERQKAVWAEKACFKCLKRGHRIDDCESRWNCRECNRKHHTLLHSTSKLSSGSNNDGGPNLQRPPNQAQQGQRDPNIGSNSQRRVHHVQQEQNVYDQAPINLNLENPRHQPFPLMTTAIVLVKDQMGQPIKCRVMLDNGSSENFISASCARRLRLPMKKLKTPIRIGGLGRNTVAEVKKFVSLEYTPHFDNLKQLKMNALVVPIVTSRQPHNLVDTSRWRFIEKLQLADPEFHIPGEIDILLGAELYWELLGFRKIAQPNAPIAVSSELGWLLGGGSNDRQNDMTGDNYSAERLQIEEQIVSNEALDSTLKSFWELESVPKVDSLSLEEKRCEAHFEKTYTRDQEGRFVVRYPFKMPRVQLGASMVIAIRRLKAVERRLSLNSDHRKEYHKFMNDYLELGHMVQVPPPKDGDKFRCYLPHHFVLKMSSTTTKFRVVFDASAKTSNGSSLNDAMMVGPVLQGSLANLIMRFRKHNVVITGDVEKMYRQILIHPEDQEYQHIVWREGPDHPIKHFRLLTVTYGTAAGPYLATKALIMLAELEGHNFPLAVKVVKEDFYVDDCLTGAASEEEALELMPQLIGLLKKGQLQIRKFTSNSQKLLMSIPEDLRETKTLEFEGDEGIKALGVYYNPQKDEFGFKGAYLSKNGDKPLTKRMVLSDIGKLFDPNGWVSPFIIRAKILMQEIWDEKTEWDKEVSQNVKMKWEAIQKEIKEIENLKIPRAYCDPKKLTADCKAYLIGFGDASKKAYAAAVYLCYYRNNELIGSSLVAAKTRVAPLKQVSLPRLELSSSLLLAEFMPRVAEGLKIDLEGMFAYSDSTLTIAWINSESHKYETFVANRITKIQDILPKENWAHIPGIDNPADCASRGITMSELINHPLWWNGPAILKNGPPKTTELGAQEPEEERRSESSCHSAQKLLVVDVLGRLSDQSSFWKAQRVLVYVKRFILKAKERLQIKKTGLEPQLKYPSYVTLEELDAALIKIISLIQQEEFPEVLETLSKKKPLHHKHQLLSLNPFLDEKGILRVGGRLTHADMSRDKKHPMLLRKHALTKLLIREAHERNLHAGPRALLSIIQQRFWILRGKDLINGVIRNCVTCVKAKAVTMEQLMGNLPAARVNPSSPFHNCGVDYAGPFKMKPLSPRSKVTFKGYIAIFVCLATKAVHLEIVSEASTSAFLNTLKRFVSRRGKPANLYSDNGTNFVGADREMEDWYKLVQSEKHNVAVADSLHRDRISWHFIPPSAPHHGGLWEAGVKSTKYHLVRAVGCHRLTFEELSTVITQIEAILNSRPITLESLDPAEPSALTPGHFLIGKPMVAVPEPDLTDVPTNRLVRWQFHQQIVQHFWKRWSDEYLTLLQQRPKWRKEQENLKVGSIVLIKEDNLPAMQWKLGRITKIHPGVDNLVRSATVVTAEHEYVRPIVKLCLLPVEAYCI